MIQSPQQVFNNVKEMIFGETWWIPSDIREVVVIPPAASNGFVVKKQNELFDLCQLGSLYQISFKWDDTKRVSVFRCKEMQEIDALYEHLLQYVSLFPFIKETSDLRKLLSLINDNWSWQPVHLASKIGIKSFFEKADKEQSLKKQMNQSSQPEQKLPLHIVIENNHIDLAKYLLTKDFLNISTLDATGRNALHYGAMASAEMIEALCKFPESKKCINVLSKDGYTPLAISIVKYRPSCTAALIDHGAILNVTCRGRSPLHEILLQKKANLKELLKVLLEDDPDLVYSAEPGTGNSGFHLATNKTSLSAIIDLCPGLNLNVLNNHGQTPLHWHSYRGDLGCVVALASYGADMSVKDLEGNTPLHVAVYNNNLDVVKCLLVFGADANVVNLMGHTPRHIAAQSKDKMKEEILRCLIVAGGKRCSAEVKGCQASCVFEALSKVESNMENLMPETEETKPPSEPSFETYLQERALSRVESLRKEGKRLQLLVSFDGGGIRGLILVKILMFIEKKLGQPLINYVDFVAGTSTGSFLAAGLSLGKSVTVCQNLYLRFKDQLFESWLRPYDTAVLEKLIKSEMGENTTLGDIKGPKLVVTTTICDVQPMKLHLLRSYKLPGLSDEENEKLGYTNPNDMFLWKALRCSSAAPTYFATVDKKYVDGGLVANNPMMDLLVDVHKYNAAAEYSKKEEKGAVGCVLSIGTGRIPDTCVECLTDATYNPFVDLKALTNLGVLMMDQVCATEGLPVERTRSWCHDMQIPYFRFSTPLSKEYVLDTKDDKEIIQMMWETTEYMCKEKEQVDSLVKLLKMLKD